MEGKTKFSRRLCRLTGTGIVARLEVIDVGCNLKQFDGLTWLALTPYFTTHLRRGVRRISVSFARHVAVRDVDENDLCGGFFNYDSTAIRPSFDSHSTSVRRHYVHSTTYVTTVCLPMCGQLHCGLN